MQLDWDKLYIVHSVIPGADLEGVQLNPPLT